MSSECGQTSESSIELHAAGQKTKSSTWDFKTKYSDVTSTGPTTRSARCVVCGATVSFTTASSSNLKRHFKRLHARSGTHKKGNILAQLTAPAPMSPEHQASVNETLTKAVVIGGLPLSIVSRKTRFLTPGDEGQKALRWIGGGVMRKRFLSSPSLRNATCVCRRRQHRARGCSLRLGGLCRRGGTGSSRTL